MDLITPQLGLIFWQLLFFGLLVLLLKKLAWLPIMAALDEREGQIQGALDLAQETRTQMEKLQADNQKLLAEARAERDAMLKTAKESADRLIADAKDKASLEGKRIMDDAREAINNERVSIMAQMKKEVVTLSLGIAEKVLRKELADKPAQERLITELAHSANMN
jgi:F-type H+-transporting ATPase subunit b